ncbi:MAG: T9SS type A sorting domain-containing protein [Bacteroidales bacterium]|nr:T9SS type A sorting domain-containing protein [Bacteroidales bacterium]
MIIKTTDGGQTWSHIHLALASQSGLTGIHFTDYNHGFAVGNGAAYKTTDGGESWSQMLDVGNLELHSVFMSSSYTGFIATERGKIFKTSDGGNSWTESSTITDNPLKSIFFTDPETGYVVGLNGNIFKTTNSGGYDAIPDVMAAKAGFRLYPNPATSKIILISTSEIAGDVDVIIYNIQGRQLFNNKLNVQNNFELDVSNLLSGIYLLEIRYKEGVETKKLIIQK